MLKLVSSNDIYMEAVRAVLLGSPGVGKTWAAAKASEYWKEGVLKDILVILSDDNGLDGLAQAGKEIPHVIDLTGLQGPRLMKALKEIPKAVEHYIKELGIKTVIDDSISMRDYNLSAHLSQIHSGFALYDALLSTHREYFFGLKSLPVNLISTWPLRLSSKRVLSLQGWNHTSHQWT